MGKVPKPRGSGQRGGDNNRANRAGHASARVHQKAAKKGCLSCGVVVVALGTATFFQAAYGAYSLVSMVAR